MKGRGDLTTFATGLSKGDVREKVRQRETFTNHLFQSYLLYIESVKSVWWVPRVAPSDLAITYNKSFSRKMANQVVLGYVYIPPRHFVELSMIVEHVSVASRNLRWLTHLL